MLSLVGLLSACKYPMVTEGGKKYAERTIEFEGEKLQFRRPCRDVDIDEQKNQCGPDFFAKWTHQSGNLNKAVAKYMELALEADEWAEQGTPYATQKATNIYKKIETFEQIIKGSSFGLESALSAVCNDNKTPKEYDSRLGQYCYGMSKKTYANNFTSHVSYARNFPTAGDWLRDNVYHKLNDDYDSSVEASSDDGSIRGSSSDYECSIC